MGRLAVPTLRRIGALVGMLFLAAPAPAPDPLPAWNNGPVKSSIVAFVAHPEWKTTQPF